MIFPYVKQANTKMQVHKYTNTEHTTKFFFVDPNTHVYCDVKQYMYQTFLSLAAFINPYTH